MRTQVSSEDDRIGKTIVAEFKHFKDVTIMVWNEEVVQLDIEAVVQEARVWRRETRLVARPVRVGRAAGVLAQRGRCRQV